MTNASSYDVIIIGSGAGGGTLAHRLAPSGKRILVLERGDYLPREKENWDPTEVCVHNRYVSPDPWRDREGKVFQPGVHYNVGGATKVFGAALFRLRREDFGELRHHDGLSPAWPLSYEDFEPYYSRAEELYQVHGRRGEDPTEPPASRPYPFPAVAHEPRIQRMHDDLLRAGYHPFHAPTGIMLNELHRAESRCLKCDTCDGYPCLVHAKADAEVIAVRPALAHPNVTLLVNAEVTSLATSASGREVTEVVTRRAGVEERYRGDIVVVSAGAANTARLLLMSASDRHPQGLANGSGQVGRNYMFHNSQAVVALAVEPNLTRFQKTIASNDFYFGDPDFDFPLGNIQMIGKSKGPMFREDAPAFAPEFTLDFVARHAVDFWLTTEDLPLTRTTASRWTARSGRIVLDYTFNNEVPTKRLYERLKSMLNHPGAAQAPDPEFGRHGKDDRDRRGGPPVRHLPFRAGSAETSVLDVNLQGS